MEGDTYEKIGEYLTLIGRTELLTCSAEQASFTKVRDQAQAVRTGAGVRGGGSWNGTGRERRGEG